MSDDKSKRGPQDANRVNVNEAYEVQYWTEEFGCTEEQLKDAVKKVGPMKQDVRQALSNKGKS